MRLELRGRRPWGRPETEEIYGRSERGDEVVNVREEDAEDSVEWRLMIRWKEQKKM